MNLSLALKAERERCARIAEELIIELREGIDPDGLARDVGNYIRRLPDLSTVEPEGDAFIPSAGWSVQADHIAVGFPET